MLTRLLSIFVFLVATAIISCSFLYRDIDQYKTASTGRSYESCQIIEHLGFYYQCMKNVAQNRSQACLNFDEGSLRQDCFSNVDHERENFIYLEGRATGFSIARYRSMIIFSGILIFVFALFKPPVTNWFPAYRKRLNSLFELFPRSICFNEVSLLKIAFCIVSLLVLVIVFLEFLLGPLLNLLT